MPRIRAVCVMSLSQMTLKNENLFCYCSKDLTINTENDEVSSSNLGDKYTVLKRNKKGDYIISWIQMKIE